jgi:predicted small lipoprotein YifL
MIMLPPMKLLVLLIAASATFALAACGDERPTHTHAEARAANQDAAKEAEKSFDKENPAAPAAMQAQ